MKRLKIVLPQWEGGVNPNYVLGARLMDLIVPAEQLPTVTIPVADVNAPEVLEANTVSMPTRPCKVN